MTLHSVVIQKLLSTNAHIGRRAATHHFKLYAYGSRNRRTIIDSDKTLICLRSAAQFVSLLARERANLMFVNTNPLFDEIIEHMSRKILGDNYNHNRATNLWRMGGFLTNSFSPKKFRSRNKKLCFGPTTLPDCVVVFDTERKSSVILEADKLQIPIVALVDSSMPWDCYKRITYPVPANDSVQFVYLFCNMITKCFLAEQKRMGKKGRDEEVEDKKMEEKKRIGEELQQIKENEDSRSKDEILFIPYANLIPLNDVSETKRLLDKLVVVNFNKALGTAIGFTGPKSMVEIRNGLTILDILVNQIEVLNTEYGCSVPLFLMNTAETHDGTVKVLRKYSKSNVDIHPLCLAENSEEKSLGGQNTYNELYSPDHGTLFLNLMSGGTVDLLLSQGKEYALVVNSENAAAAIDPKILNHLVQGKIGYCMEVISSYTTDPSNRMPNTQQKFRLADITRDSIKDAGYGKSVAKLTDTGNTWIDLKALRKVLDVGRLKMENLSALEATNGETASLQEMTHSAVQFFDQAIGIGVPHSRYLPVNGMSDLFLLQSDLYTYSEGSLVRNSARTNTVDPSIDLGVEFQTVTDFHKRFKSIPSIVGLDSLSVSGDVWFGADIVLKGNVSIDSKPGMKLELPDGLVLENKVINDPADI